MRALKLSPVTLNVGISQICSAIIIYTDIACLYHVFQSLAQMDELFIHDGRINKDVTLVAKVGYL